MPLRQNEARYRFHYSTENARGTAPMSPRARHLSTVRDNSLKQLEPSLCRFSVAQMPTNLKRSASFPVYNIHPVSDGEPANRCGPKDPNSVSSIFVVLNITVRRPQLRIRIYICSTYMYTSKLSVIFSLEQESRSLERSRVCTM